MHLALADALDRVGLDDEFQFPATSRDADGNAVMSDAPLDPNDPWPLLRPADRPLVLLREADSYVYRDEATGEILRTRRRPRGNKGWDAVLRLGYNEGAEAGVRRALRWAELAVLMERRQVCAGLLDEVAEFIAQP